MWKVVFIIVAVVILVVFLSQSNLLGSLSFLRGIFSTSTFPGYGFSPAASPTAIKSGVSEINPEDIPVGFPKNRISPFFRKVRIQSVTAAQSAAPDQYEAVTLAADIGENASMSIGRWTLMSNRGHEFIPPAVGVLDPSVPARAGDILLQNGDIVNLYSSPSPMNANFRVNKCMGYLNAFYHFDPPLAESCPAIDRRDIETFTGACQDYLLSLGSCRSSLPGYLIPSYDYACRAYVQNLNYQGCVNFHRSDADFSGNEWRAWTGQRFLDPVHDRVLLFDGKGLLVDQYIY